MCLINSTQYCSDCGRAIRSPIKMDLCYACEDKSLEKRAVENNSHLGKPTLEDIEAIESRTIRPNPGRKIKVDPIKGPDLREAQIKRRQKIQRDAMKLAKKGKKKPLKKKKSAEKSSSYEPFTTPASNGWCSTIERNQKALRRRQNDW